MKIVHHDNPIETKVRQLILEGKTEDAVLILMYELSTKSVVGNILEDELLARVNTFLKVPFTIEDLHISLEVLRNKNFITDNPMKRYRKDNA